MFEYQVGDILAIITRIGSVVLPIAFVYIGIILGFNVIERVIKTTRTALDEDDILAVEFGKLSELYGLEEMRGEEFKETLLKTYEQAKVITKERVRLVKILKQTGLLRKFKDRI